MPKSLLSTFTRTQNAPAELRRRYPLKFSKDSKPYSVFFFCDFFKTRLENLKKKMAIFFVKF